MNWKDFFFFSWMVEEDENDQLREENERLMEENERLRREQEEYDQNQWQDQDEQ